MNEQIKYFSRINDEFDTVICGVNGVFMRGDTVNKPAIDALIKMYQSGKKIALASNSGMRVRDLYYLLKSKGVPMNIFYAMITAGEIAHFYLLNNHNLGRTYYNLSGNVSMAAEGLNYVAADNPIMADFVLAETESEGMPASAVLPALEQALHLKLPLLCIGNNTSLVGSDKIIESVGAAAEKYALMGGQVVAFGKPDVRIAAYLTETIFNFKPERCLIIGDCMATDMRMGNNFGAKTLLIGNGVHQLSENPERELNELSLSYGLNIDYYMETLLW